MVSVEHGHDQRLVGEPRSRLAESFERRPVVDLQYQRASTGRHSPRRGKRTEGGRTVDDRAPQAIDAQSRCDARSPSPVRVEAEHGACAGKKEIATRAKELGYDAIHDTVHEMCKDEARHGQAFKGLLDRYFG